MITIGLGVISLLVLVLWVCWIWIYGFTGIIKFGIFPAIISLNIFTVFPFLFSSLETSVTHIFDPLRLSHVTSALFLFKSFFPPCASLWIVFYSDAISSLVFSSAVSMLLLIPYSVLSFPLNLSHYRLHLLNLGL